MRKFPQALTVATAVFGLALLTNTTYAQEDHTRQVEHAGAGPNSVLIADVSKGRVEPGATQTEVGHPITDGPAPPLSKIFVNNVCTDSVGNYCETIASGQGATTNTYHAAAAYVFVWEIGYGNGEIATQGGAQISNTYLVGKVPVCTSGGYYTTSCPNGSTITGWRYEWNAGYYLNQGYGIHFAAQDTSINSPYNTVSTFINIQYSK